MSTCSPTCVKPRPGSNAQHCKVEGCHQTFGGTGAGDLHRVGRHGVDRRCLTPAEMEAAGLRLVRGIWKREGPLTRRAAANPAAVPAEASAAVDEQTRNASHATQPEGRAA